MNYSLCNNISTKENRIYQRENKTMKKINEPKNQKLIFKCLIIIELILQILSRSIFNIIAKLCLGDVQVLQRLI